MALMTGAQYRASLQDEREVWINGERVKDVTRHPHFEPIIAVRARIYDLAQEPAYRDRMSFADENGERCNTAYRLPRTKDDWHAKWDWGPQKWHKRFRWRDTCATR